MRKTTLKSLAWLTMCLCALVFTACSSDGGGGGSETTDARSSIVGTWELASCSEPGAPVGATYVFNANGTGILESEETMTFNYTYMSDGEFTLQLSNGIHILGTLIVSDNVASGTYSKSGSSAQYSFTFRKESGNSDDSDENKDGELTVNMQNLAGTWQSIHAKGYNSKDNRYYETKTLSGLDSLDAPVLMTLNTNMTYISYWPSWSSWDGQYNNSPDFTWRKSGIYGAGGDGTILLVGKQLQLTDDYGSSYCLRMTITSLTSKRLVGRIDWGYGDYDIVTYGRDGDGADYFSSNSPQEDEDETPVSPTPSLIADMAGTWELVHTSGIRFENETQTEDWDEDVPAGNVRIIITPDGAWKAMEYSHSTNTWHEDSSGTFYMQGDQLAVTGEMEQFSIYSLTKNEMTIEYMKQEDKGSVIVQKYHHDTFKRIN